MANSVFQKSPVEAVLEGETARGEGMGLPAYAGARTTGESTPPQLPDNIIRAAVDQAAIRYQVPANVLMALSEADGSGSAPMLKIDGAAKRLQSALGQGKSVEDLLSPEVLKRAAEIGDQLYTQAPEVAPARPDVEPPKAVDSEPSGLAGAGRDMVLQLTGGAYKGLGSIARGAGALSQGIAESVTGPIINRIFGTDYQPANLADPAADALHAFGERGQSGVSNDTKDAIKNSTPDGDLFRPSTWTLGKAPSLRGYTALALDIFGGMLPVVAASVASGGAAAAVVGGLQGGGAAVEGTREAIDQMANTPTDGPGSVPVIARESAYYRGLREAGRTHEQAVKLTRRAAERTAFLFTAPVSALGGAATSRIINPAEGALTRGPLIARIAGRATLSGLEEGVQEVGETVAQNAGTNVGAGTNLSLTEGTFADFLLGALGGAGPGAASGALSTRQQAEGHPSQAPAPEARGAPLDAPASPEAPVAPEADPAAPDANIAAVTDAVSGDAPAAVAAPQPEGPLSRALAAAEPVVAPNPAPPAPEQRVTVSAEGMDAFAATLEVQNEAGVVLRDGDGNRYEIPADELSAGTVTIAPHVPQAEAPAAEIGAPAESSVPAQTPPTTEDVTKDAVGSEQTAEDRSAVVGGDPRSKAQLGAMTRDELFARRDYLETQARTNGGWNKRLTGEKARVDAALAKVGGAGVEAVSDAPLASDAGAHEAATSPLNDHPEPTQAQKEAGNYKVGRLSVGGLDISVENPEGSQRKGVDRAGKPWTVKMKSHYGYIRGTVGKDKDHVDVFVRPGTTDVPDTATAFVIDQRNADGAFDEHKVMLGFDSLKQAQKAYLANYTKGWKGLGAITPMPMAEFREWVRDPAKTRVPAGIANSKVEPVQEQAASVRDDASKVEPKITRLNDDFGNYILESGARLYSRSARALAPSPKADVSTPRKRNRTLFLQRQWLIDEARKEAAAAGDKHMGRMFEAMQADNLSRSDMDTINEFLFGSEEPGAASFKRPEQAPMTRETQKQVLRPHRDRSANEAASTPSAAMGATQEITDGFTANREAIAREKFKPGEAVEYDHAHFYRDGRSRTFSGKVVKVSDKDQGIIEVLNDGGGNVFVPARRLRRSNTNAGPAVAPRGGDAPADGAAKYGASNTFITADRAAELRKQLKAKLRSQVNSGIDPEVLAIGAQLAAFHIEAGARSFAKFAQAVAADLDTNIATIRPYLRAWYNGARDMMEDAGLDISGTDDPVTVRAALDKLPAEETVNEPGKLDQSGAGTLEGVPAPEVSRVAEGGDAQGGPDAGRRGDASGNERTGKRRLLDQRSVGDDAGEVPVRSRGEPEGRAGGERSGAGARGVDAPQQQAPASGQRSGVEPSAGATAAERGSDFAHAGADIGRGGAKTKFKNNINAIRLLKELEASGRPATRQEQVTLSKYVGWGGLPQAFARSDNGVTKGWEKEALELRELLTPEEYRAAEASTRNAHYTSPEIVQAMWAAVRRLGFKRGRVLEPSVGVGNFFGMMPTEMRNGSALHGVELDHITGGIAKHLYPAAKIAAPMGFQDFAIPDGHFDLVIGNPPFGAEKLYDGRRKDLSGFSIHNYFFAKSIDALRPNGVLAMVVTNRMMDGASDKARQYIADRAELVGAVRLPNDAFLANAGTQVTTDIIFLRKRAEGEGNKGESWMEVKDFTDKAGKTVPLNEYFHRNPDQMLGEFGAFGSMYRPDDPALVAREDQDTSELLEEAIMRFPEAVMGQSQPRPVAEEPAAEISRAESVRVGSMFRSDDGRIMVREEDSLGEAQAREVRFPNERAAERIAGLIEVRDHFTDLRRLQLDPKADDVAVEAARGRLNTVYDAFVKSHGPINLDANKRLFRDDPSWPQVAALEDNFDKGVSPAMAKSTGQPARSPSAKKAAVFSRRTQRPYAAPTEAKSAKDALVASLSETGRVDLDLMSRLYRKPPEAIIRELDDLIYQDPQRGWMTRDEYLSGNVKRKLADVMAAAKTDQSLRRNVDALQAVQPADIAAIDINVKPGAHWLPERVMREFATHISGDARATAIYNPANARWAVAVRAGAEASARWATGRAGLNEVIEAAANQRTITIRDRVDRDTTVINETQTQLANDKVRAVSEEWSRWVWQDDERRESLGRLYNDMFNTDVERVFDGSHLTFPGKVGDDIVALRPHQANAVWRIVQSGTTLLDHVVGAGKTFTMVAAAMELRRMGLAKKPMFVVPNHLVGQWASDFVRLYPGAKVLAPTKKDFEKENRKRLFARIATGDWDAVIVAHSSFGKVEVEPAAQAQFIEEQIADLQKSQDAMRQAEGKEGKNVKQIQAQITARREKMKKLLDADNKDDSLFWGELGVDALFTDEAHEFKNLEFSTSMQRVAGLGNQSGSQKASDMLLKKRQVLKATGGRNLVDATGTPISNTMAEMFTFQRYLDHANLEAQGLAHFDAWARMFGEVVTDWELSPSGQYKLNSRFARFVNMPELMQRYRSFADVVNRDDINAMLAAQGKRLPVPRVKGGKPDNVVVERSADQARYIGEPLKDADGNDTDHYPKGSLIYRAEHLPKRPQKGDDNMLKIMSDARKAALDMRLIDPSYADNPGSKVNEAARRIMALYRQWDADKGVQLVFIDLSTPKAARGREAERIRELVKRSEAGDEAATEELDQLNPDELSALDSPFSVYDDLRQKLIQKGIPADEVAFIHEANTELQKEQLFGRVRSGRVRVLLGSTQKMGAGTNVQERLVALHHLDAPWRPSDLEQREGRIIRQGNVLYDRDPEGFEVEINRYATKQTLDSRMWQTIEGKANFIEQVRKGGADREIEDVGGEAANAAEMKAASSGNPLVLEEMSLRQAIRRLDTERYGHDSEQYRIRDSIRRMKRSVEVNGRLITQMREDAKLEMPADFAMTITGKDYDKRKDAGAAILAAVRLMEATYADHQPLGSYGGFKLTLDRFAGKNFTITASAEGEYQTTAFSSEADEVGLAQRVVSAVRGLEAEADKLEREIARDEKAIPRLEEQLSEWGKAGELASLKERHAAVLEKLKPKKRDQAKEAKNSVADGEAGEGGTSAADAQAHLRNGAYGIAVSAMLDAGRVVIHDVQSDLPADLRDGGGIIQGVTDAKGVIHLVAGNLTTETLQPALFHEVFHALGEEAPAWRGLIRRLETIYAAQAAKTPDLRPPFWRDAMRRVEGANVDPRYRGEELGAYAIEHREQAPAGILSVIDNLVGRVKDWLLRKTGVQVGAVTPGQLRAFTIAVLRAARAPAQQAKARAFSLKDFGPNDFIPAPDGGLDFGRIDVDVARAIQREAAPIRVKAGNEDFGLRHIEMKGDEITGTYKDAREFVADVAKNFDAIYRASGRRLFLAMTVPGRNRSLIVELNPTPDGAAYVVVTGGMRRDGYFARKEPLWERAPSNQAVSGSPDAVSGQSGSNIVIPDADDDKGPRFSLAGEPIQKQDRWLSNRLSDALTAAMPKLLATAPLRPMLEELGKGLPAAKEYLRTKQQMDALRNEWHARVAETADEWLKYRSHNRAENAELMSLMHEATLSQNDPTESFKPRFGSRDATVMRYGNPDTAEWHAANRKAEEDKARRAAYKTIKAKYDALSPDGKRLFALVRDTYSALADEFEKTILDNMEKALKISVRRAEREHRKEMQRIVDEGLTGKEREEAIKDADRKLKAMRTKATWNARWRLSKMRSQFESNRLTGPYFPLSRFGDFFVTVRDGEGAVVSFSRFESPAKQRAFAKEMRREEGMTVEVGVLSEGDGPRGQVDPHFVADVEEMLAGADVPDALKDQIWQRYLETLPDFSIRKRRIHRLGRAGFQADALRAFASNMFHGAHQLARTRFGMDLAEHLKDAREQAKEAPDPVRAGLVVNEMEARDRYIMNPEGSAWAQAISTAAFVYHLSMSPAAALVNVSQTVMIGVPVLGAYLGGAKGMATASAEIARASRDFAMGRGSAEQSSRLSDDERRAMQVAYSSGVIDKSQAHDLAGVGETGIEYSARRQKVMNAVSWAFHQTERFNREVTFLAAYRAARSTKVSQNDAINEASGLTWKTHFDYQNTSRPRLMHGDFARTLLIFRNYNVNMLFRLFRDTHQALNGASAEDRSEARTQLFGVTAMMVANAGIRGTWMFGLATMLAGLFFGLAGDGDDPEEELQKAVVGALGPTLGGMVLNGIPGHLMGVSLSERIGMPDLWFRSPDRQLEGQDAYHFWQDQMLGAGVGMVQNWFRGYQMIAEGNVYRGVETMAPKAIRDLMRTYRFATEGATTLKGDPVVDAVSPADLLKQAIGFTPAQIAERYQINNWMKNREQGIVKERRDLMSDYYKAQKAGDEVEVGKVLKRIENFNASNSDHPITGRSLSQSIKSRIRASDRNEGGVMINPKLNDRIRSEAAPQIYK